MEPKFQTSFIPKSPVVSTPNNKPTQVYDTNIFSLIATAFFTVTLIVAGGLFGYKYILNKQIADYGRSIDDARGALEVDKIQQLLSEDKRLSSSKVLLDKHISMTGLFSLIQDLTVKKIRITELSYNNVAGIAALSIKGDSQTYNALADQEDVFRKNDSLKDSYFSDLRPGINGSIAFSFKATVMPDIISYKKLVESLNTNQ
ncbi:MAG: hypothetical protein ABL899_02445 [Nitrospira sp.]